MLTNVFDLAAPHIQFNDFGVSEIPQDSQSILDIEQLFESSGMINCGRLLYASDADHDEYMVDPVEFRIRDLYDRRMPKTHFFSIYNVKKACPIRTKNITTMTMNRDDDNEYFSFMPDAVERRNRSVVVRMKLRHLFFTV